MRISHLVFLFFLIRLALLTLHNCLQNASTKKHRTIFDYIHQVFLCISLFDAILWKKRLDEFQTFATNHIEHFCVGFFFVGVYILNN